MDNVHPFRSTPRLGMRLKVGSRQKAIPVGEYKAQVIEIRESKYMKRPILEFHFEIAEGPYRGELVRGFVNANYESFSAHSKLFQWFTRVTGREPEDEFSLDAFYGRVLLVKVDDKTSKMTKNKFSNVTDVMRTIIEL